MTALLRPITLITAIALLMFVGLHAVVPHDHPGHEHQPVHGSEIPPVVAHSENKMFLLVLVALLLPILFDLISRMVLFMAETCALLRVRERLILETIPIRWSDALRRGNIHSKAY